MRGDDKALAEDLIMGELLHTSISQHHNHRTNPSTRDAINPLDQFLTECGIINNVSSSSTNPSRQRTPREEIAMYVNKVQRDDSFQVFWKTNQNELPGLADLMKSYNMRPATSVASESLFSIANYVQNKHRSSLAPTTLKYSMVLRDREAIAHLV